MGYYPLKVKDSQGTVHVVGDPRLGSLTASDVDAVPTSAVTAKGSLIAASGSATPADLPVGSDGQILLVDSGETVGVKWGEPWDSAGFIIGQQVFS